MNMIEKVVEALDNAKRSCPYGLYDYSSYEGNEHSHQVKDERSYPNKVIFKSNDHIAASVFHKKMTEEYAARAAIEALKDFEIAAYTINSMRGCRIDDEMGKVVWNNLIEAALNEND